MAITDAQKVDYLYKKIGAGVAKTDTSAFKSPSNEANASPILTRGDTIWQQSVNIPVTIPAGNTSVLSIYSDLVSTTIECTLDTTVSGTNRTWLTNLQDWVGPEFGATYQVKVYAAAPGINNAQTVGTQLFSDGSGNSDSWFFDYQAGILNFPDTNVPAALSGKKVYITGARYVGQKGLTVFPSMTVGNLTFDGNSISSSSGNVSIAANLNVLGNTTFYGYSDLTISDSILNLHTQGNLAPWTFNDGKDIGIKMHYYDTQDSHSALIRANDTGFLEWYARGTEITGNTFQGAAYGTIKTGEIWLSNTVSSTNTTTGVLRVDGGAGIQGNLYAGNITSEATLTVNSDAYIVGNATVGNIAISGNLAVDTISGNTFNGNVVGNVLTPYQPYITSVGLLTNLAVNGTTITNSSIYAPTFIGNVVTDLVTSNTGSITLTTLGTGTVDINANTALRLPAGTTAERPVGTAGDIRVNTDSGVLEYFGGVSWIPLTYSVSDQSFTGDGTNDTYSLDQVTTEAGIIVSINGTIQQPHIAYTVSGDQITFAEIPEPTDVVNIRYIASAVTVDDNTRTIGSGNVIVGTTLTLVDSFDKTLYRSVKYTISSHNPFDDQMAEVLVLQGNNTVVINTTSVLNTGANTVTFSANISGNDVNLLALGTTDTNNLRVQRTYFNV